MAVCVKFDACLPPRKGKRLPAVQGTERIKDMVNILSVLAIKREVRLEPTLTATRNTGFYLRKKKAYLCMNSEI
jgi:hypothetical protein